MHTIQIFNQIARQGLNILEGAGFSFVQSNPTAILLRSEKLHDYTFSDTVKVVVRAGAGVNNIPVDALTQRGIPVLNTPGANANAVKELVLCALLMSVRNVFPACNNVKTLAQNPALHISDALDKEIEKTKKAFKGTELLGKRLAVLGLGAIGGSVAKSAVALGLDVIGFDSHLTVDNALRLSTKVKKASSMMEAISNADFISVHVPYIDSTHHLINAAVLKQMKKGATLLNFSRALIVEQSALIASLKDGHIHQYLTDFPSPELMCLNNVLAFPHLGASTQEAEDNCALMAANQLVEFLKTGEITHSVNFPSLSLPVSTAHRLALSNLNRPSMLGQITNVLAELNLNIVEMSNRSRGDIAYSLIDIDKAPGDIAGERLSNIEGLLSYRYIAN